MHARVMSVTLDLGALDEATQGWKQRVSRHRNEGMKGAYLLVDETTGNTMSITLWESAEALDSYNRNPVQAKAGQEMAKYFKSEPAFTIHRVMGVVD